MYKLILAALSVLQLVACTTSRRSSPADLSVERHSDQSTDSTATDIGVEIVDIGGCLKDPDQDIEASTADTAPELDASADQSANRDLNFDSDLTADGGVDALTDLIPPDLIAPDLPLCPDGGPVEAGAAGCPTGMVPVGVTLCVDQYEASRVDATEASAGMMEHCAPRSVAGVLPWQNWNLNAAMAQTYCARAGKRLCTTDEWQNTCQGPLQTIYAYGDDYDPTICNGIETFCYCDAGPCASVTPCPYPYCYGTCGAQFHVTPTGAHPGCTNAWGLYDLNGNVWEIVNANDALRHFRGGAFNCSDSKTNHRCDYDATWNPLARGFRCCADR